MTILLEIGYPSFFPHKSSSYSGKHLEAPLYPPLHLYTEKIPKMVISEIEREGGKETLCKWPFDLY